MHNNKILLAGRVRNLIKKIPVRAGRSWLVLGSLWSFCILLFLILVKKLLRPFHLLLKQKSWQKK